MRAQGTPQGAAVILDPRSGAVLALASVPSYDPNGFVLGFGPAGPRADAVGSAAAAPVARGGGPLPDRVRVQADHLRRRHGRTRLHPRDGARLPVDLPARRGQSGLGGLDRRLRRGGAGATDAASGACQLLQHRLLRHRPRSRCHGPGLPAADDQGLWAGSADRHPLSAGGGRQRCPIRPGSWKRSAITGRPATRSTSPSARASCRRPRLQLATAYAAIANGGYLLQPYIVSEIVDPDGAREPVGERIVRGRLPVSGADA